MVSCGICKELFGIFRFKHSCRLCRESICESCSQFKNRNDIIEYRWCSSWISNQFPSFVSFLTHENEVRMCVRCANWDHTQMKAIWKVVSQGWLPLTDIGSLAQTNSGMRIVSGVFLQRIRKLQENALIYNTKLSKYESSCAMIPFSTIQLRDRWNFLVSEQLIMPKSNQLLDMMELLWKMKRCVIHSHHKKRSMFGLLWSNHSTKKIRLLYSLAKILNVEFIPQRLETLYGIRHKKEWIEWIQNDEDTLPKVECPIWNELIQTPVSQSILPSATRPRLIRWGNPSHGLLWKRESGSVDRIVEYSIALCSESLKECGILTHSQIWYDVAMLSSDITAIQIVPNCVSLSSLVDSGKTILEHICDNNDTFSVSAIRQRLMESIAFCGAISWFYGFGDRHLDNIMVSNDGTLFHIDFGFCFGREPKLGVPRIRITKDMVQTLGEMYWKQCLKKGQIIMDWLRSHVHTLRIITDGATGDSKNHIDQHWNKVQSDPVTFEELAFESIHSWTTNLHDFFHSKAQSLRSISSIWRTITQE